MVEDLIFKVLGIRLFYNPLLLNLFSPLVSLISRLFPCTLLRPFFLFGWVQRYVTAGTAWLNGAFSKVAKVGHVAGAKTREKFQLAVTNLTAKVSFTTARVRTCT